MEGITLDALPDPPEQPAAVAEALFYERSKAARYQREIDALAASGTKPSASTTG